MDCRQCGAELHAGAVRCPDCNTPVDEPVTTSDAEIAVSGAGTGPSVGAGAGGTVGPKPAVAFNLARLTRGERTVGVASLVVFIALLLPWYGTGLTSFTVDGLWHGWMYIALLLALATVGYVVALAAVDVRLPVPHWQALLGATGLTLLLVVLGIVTTPTGATLEWGAIVGILAAVAAFAGALLRRREPARP